MAGPAAPRCGQQKEQLWRSPIALGVRDRPVAQSDPVAGSATPRRGEGKGQLRWKKQSLKAIQWLVQEHPDAVKEQNSEGNLPLHVACKFKQSLAVITNGAPMPSREKTTFMISHCVLHVRSTSPSKWLISWSSNTQTR